MTTLIRIGNSQGVRIPKAIIEQAQLEGNELLFKVNDDGLLIQPLQKSRQGWKKEFEKILKFEKTDPIDQEWIDQEWIDQEWIDQEWIDQEWLDVPLNDIEDWEW